MNSIHAFSEAERSAVVRYINSKLAFDSSLQHLLPLDPNSNEIFSAVKDGILLAKILDSTIPNTIHTNSLHLHFTNELTKRFQILENHRLTLEAAKKIGCTIVNISGEDLMEGKPYLVFGLLWQIIRAGLFLNINLTNHPELSRFYSPNEDTGNVHAESLLLKWFNFYASKAGFSLPISNFAADLSDSSAYAHLLHALNDSILSRSALNDILAEKSIHKRAELMLHYAHLIDPSSELFLKPDDITNSREKLNLCFIASLFNSSSGLQPLHQELETKIETLQDQLLRERAGTEDLNSLLAAMQLRIDNLQAENAALKEQLVLKDEELQLAHRDKNSVEAKFTGALSKWDTIQVQYENEIKTLENKNIQLENSLSHAQIDLIHEKRQAETYGVCADSLSDELEAFRSKQEKLEYLIEHLKVERARCDQFSYRLRTLYRSFSSTELLCKALYFEEEDGSSRNMSLSLQKIIKHASKCGTLTKKARDGSNWKVRYFVQCDNFLFYYKSEDLRGEPQGVVRLDDCVSRYAENPTSHELKGMAILCIEISNHGHLKDVKSDGKSGKLNFYVAGTIIDLDGWKREIDKASGWWTRKSYYGTLH